MKLKILLLIIKRRREKVIFFLKSIHALKRKKELIKRKVKIIFI